MWPNVFGIGIKSVGSLVVPGVVSSPRLPCSSMQRPWAAARDSLVITSLIFHVICWSLSMLSTGNWKLQYAYTVWGGMQFLQTKDFTFSKGGVFVPSWELGYEHGILCRSRGWDSSIILLLFSHCLVRLIGADLDFLRVDFSVYWHGLLIIPLFERQ